MSAQEGKTGFVVTVHTYAVFEIGDALARAFQHPATEYC